MIRLTGLAMVLCLPAWLLASGTAKQSSGKRAGTESASDAAVAEGNAKGPDRSGPARIAVISITGGIFLGTEEYVEEALKRAEKEGFDALVIEIDTPGGALDQTQQIVKAMLSAGLPVITFDTPKGAQAASAGTFIVMAGHVAAMAPGTRIGAAHPVSISFMPGMPGGDEKDEKKKEQQKQQEQIMQEKITNDTVSFIRSIASERGRNADWAEKAVRESVSVTAEEALKLGVVDVIADDLQHLLDKIDGRKVELSSTRTVQLHTRDAEVVRWEKSLKQRLLGALASPNLLMLLFLIGLGGLAMEFYHPGLIVPGAVGGLCLLLALISMQILPVSIGGLLLVLAGLGLLVAEGFVTSYGLLAIGGSVLLLLGGIMLVDPSSQPHYLDPSFTVDWSVLVPTVVVLAALVVTIGYKVIKTQRSRITTGREGMIGQKGKARSRVTADGGTVFVRGEYWKASSDEPIEEGSKVEVVGVDGLELKVKRVD
ncbi:MAG: nodulation protein NfeD [Deltaproteobacteria bacterium]|nr:MAG: nodulation protein NfeD [Deltaproteobacteria bacterium]